MTAIALGLQGYDVIATDKLNILTALNHNIKTFESSYNGSNPLGSFKIVEFDWNKTAETAHNQLPVELREALNGREIDLIACSDCCYSSLATLPLLRSLQAVSATVWS